MPLTVRGDSAGQLGDALGQLGWVSRRDARGATAFRSALDLLEDDRPERAWAMSNLGSALYGLGSRAGDAALLEEAVEGQGGDPLLPLLRSLLYLGLDGADSCTTSHARERRPSSGRMRGGCPTCEVS